MIFIPINFVFLATNNDDSTRALLVAHVRAFCSALIAAPPHPEKGNFVFAIMTALIKRVKRWGGANTGMIRVYFAILKLCESRVSGRRCTIGGKVIQSLSYATADFGEDITEYKAMMEDLAATMEAANLKWAAAM